MTSPKISSWAAAILSGIFLHLSCGTDAKPTDASNSVSGECGTLAESINTSYRMVTLACKQCHNSSEQEYWGHYPKDIYELSDVPSSAYIAQWNNKNEFHEKSFNKLTLAEVACLAEDISSMSTTYVN